VANQERKAFANRLGARSMPGAFSSRKAFSGVELLHALLLFITIFKLFPHKQYATFTPLP
jgi:hypothetical protein